MAYTWTLLFSLLPILSVCTASPLPSVEVMKRAKQLVVRLDEFQFPTELTTGALDYDFSGTKSIVAALERCNSPISESLEGVTQVKTELSSLISFLRQLRQCSEDPEPTPQDQRFTQSKTFESLKRTREYLQQLQQNLDNLDTC
ncbi:leptin-like [Gasterosteus aculeatus]|uniref:Leptin n=1 Tax=Gasterosteus aculeatus aculeatus TaxID=481459 RepID=A0AAQ4R2D7_GASAC